MRLLPLATTVGAMLCSVEPIPISGYPVVAPAFVLMAAYHWTIYRPDLLPAAALFMIGTAQDILCGAPIGVTALLLLLVRLIVLGRRRHFVNRSFAFIWSGFTLLLVGATMVVWTLNSLLAGQLLDFRDAVFRAVLTISVFPIVSFLLGRSQRGFSGAV